MVGPGDLHDEKFTDFAKWVVLNDGVDFPTGAKTSAVYTLTVYPTEVMFDVFRTDAPLDVALGFFGAIAACACIFLAYDYLMRHDAQQRKFVLDMKRKFVRFISHEIRTPLNTVCMGLELLESEFQDAKNSDKNMGAPDEEDVDFWLNVAADVKENAHGTLDLDIVVVATSRCETACVFVYRILTHLFLHHHPSFPVCCLYYSRCVDSK